MEFITTKGKPALVFDGSRFTLNRRVDNGVCYCRCTKRSCPARITTEGNQQTSPHNVVDTQLNAIQSDVKEPGKKSHQCVQSTMTIWFAWGPTVIVTAYILYLLLQVWSSVKCTKVRPNGTFSHFVRWECAVWLTHSTRLFADFTSNILIT